MVAAAANKGAVSETPPGYWTSDMEGMRFLVTDGSVLATTFLTTCHA